MNYLDDLLTGKNFPSPIVNRVFDYAYSQQNLSGNLYKPIIDELWLNENGKKPNWPDNKPYAVCITHDVDVISLQSNKENIRRIEHILKTWKQQKCKQNSILVFESLENIKKGVFSKQDPYHRFEDWLKIEQEVGARSTFFFAPEYVLKPHYTDCWYKYDDVLKFEGEKISVEELMREINKRGWEIGLHPSWNSYNSVDELKYQKDQVEKVIDNEIVSIRQHFLHFDNKITPKVQSAAGFKYDTTLGFNDNIGFRRGTSYAYPLIDLTSNDRLPIWEIPLIIQDGAMFHPKKGMRLNKEMALQYIMMLKDKVKRVGGILTLLWHPHSIHNAEVKEVFEETMTLLKSDDPWFATVGEIGSWWENKIKIDLLSFVEKEGK